MLNKLEWSYAEKKTWLELCWKDSNGIMLKRLEWDNTEQTWLELSWKKNFNYYSVMLNHIKTLTMNLFTWFTQIMHFVCIHWFLLFSVSFGKSGFNNNSLIKQRSVFLSRDLWAITSTKPCFASNGHFSNNYRSFEKYKTIKCVQNCQTEKSKVANKR